MRILIIGGYGNAGKEIVSLLLQKTDHFLTIGGRNREKGKTFIQSFKDPDRLSFTVADTTQPENLFKILQSQDLVIVASSTTRDIHHVAKAAVKADTHYLDIQLSFPYKLDFLKSLRDEIIRKNLTFITDGGFHPGVPAVLIRYAGMKFDQLQKANVGSLIKINWKAYHFSENTMYEFMDEFRYYKSKALRNGSMKSSGFSPPTYFNFSDPYGKQPCNAMWLDELEDMPDYFPALADCGFYVGGFNWFSDYLLLPLIMGAIKINPGGAHRKLARLFTWSLKHFSKPPFATELILDASGIVNGKNAAMKLGVRHADAYLLTAAPVVATLMQFFDQPHAQPGLWFQGHYPEPFRFLNDLRQMDIEIKEDFDGPEEGQDD